MRIDVVADIVCPWCYIGIRRLRAALNKRPDVRPAVHWRPYLLNPDVGPEGMRQAEFLARAFGSESRVRRFQETVQRAGKSVGIEFRFESADFTPFALPAHRLLSLLDGESRVLELADTLFTGYFTHGQNLGDIEVLAEAGKSYGIKRSDVVAAVTGADSAASITIDDSETHRLGINGVPSFIFAEQHVISGAHDDEVLTHMIDVAAAGFPRGENLTSLPASSI
ncbi:MAG: DsbA family oxidoreductase [Rhodospirillales bacterium]